MRVFVLSVGGLVTLTLVVAASRFFWRQLVSLRYVREDDEWSQDIPEWHL